MADIAVNGTINGAMLNGNLLFEQGWQQMNILKGGNQQLASSAKGNFFAKTDGNIVTISGWFAVNAQNGDWGPISGSAQLFKVPDDFPQTAGFKQSDFMVAYDSTYPNNKISIWGTNIVAPNDNTSALGTVGEHITDTSVSNAAIKNGLFEISGFNTFKDWTIITFPNIVLDKSIAPNF